MKRKLLLIFLVLFVFSEAIFAQTRIITGIITGKEDGLPLPGVSVMVKGTKTGTQSGPDGSYAIKLPDGQSLVFSFIGYNIQTVIPNGLRLNVIMAGTTSTLNEVQVIGYGTQSKRESVGSISTVKGSEIVEQPVQNFVQSLAGKASGVQITIANGVSNTPPVFHIRGTNSIALSSQPLIVVDGVPSYSGDYSGGESGGSGLANINPDDIESIDIAKDGASTAIYGSRAANGVVFVTTKKGKKGDAVVSVDSWIGMTKVNRLPKVLDAYQYVTLKNEALKNAGLYNDVVTTPQTKALYYAGLGTDAAGNTINTNWKNLV
ncbi:MAG: TonB-dependent receptor plug domain-containing protein [Janthinobacterium lividum]